MTVDDKKAAELFQILEHLSGLDEEDLLACFTSGNIEVLRLAWGILKEGAELERVLSEKRFVDIVKELEETRRIWSARFEGTQVNASREMDRGNRVQAMWILDGFIRFCPSSYYRNMALRVLEEYEGPDPGDGSQ